MSERTLPTPREVVDGWLNNNTNFRRFDDLITTDRRALVEALLAECPVCGGLDPQVPCSRCRWVRVFAVREGLMGEEKG